jgi:hypothetical protein
MMFLHRALCQKNQKFIKRVTHKYYIDYDKTGHQNQISSHKDIISFYV